MCEVLNRYDAKRVQHGTDEYCKNTNRRYPFNHNIVKFLFAEASVQFNLVSDRFRLNDKANENAGKHAHYRHQHTVRDEIKKIKNAQIHNGKVFP